MPVFTIYAYGPDFARAYGVMFDSLEEAQRSADKRWPDWTTGAVSLDDPLPAELTEIAAKLKSEKKKPPHDPLRIAIVKRALELDLTAYAIAKMCKPDGPDSDSVKRYFTGRIALNSRYVSLILEVLGWDGEIKFEE